MSYRTHIHKLLYAALFCILLPIVLIVWASLSTTMPQSLPFSPEVGLAISVAGAILVIWAMFTLWYYGKGLPMNAFPPEHFVHRGPYALFAHPIYIGFAAVVAGVALYLKSASGFWLVFPITTAAIIALLQGYELAAIRKLFGNAIRPPFFRLPKPEISLRSAADVASMILFIAFPFFVLLEIQRPTLHQEFFAAVLTFGLCISAVVVKQSQERVRQTIEQAWTLFVINLLSAFFIPDPQILLASTTFWLLLRTTNTLRFAAMAIFASLGISQLSMIAYGMLCGVIAERSFFIWRSMLRISEWFANSWHEWHVGRIRIINHGAYPALGIAIGLPIIFSVEEPQVRMLFVLFSLVSVIGAAIWGQVLEGSSKLSRPFGYYGAAFAILLFAPLSSFVGLNPWHLLAGFVLAGPWIQAFGRLRCLVQGCCHGEVTDAAHGIVYRQPLSRVLRISELGHKPLVPTQLYSIIWNVVSGIVLAGLWRWSFPASFIVGMYSMLSGIGRFVEESRRGEKQTKILAGLHIYQWLAISTVVLGMIFTMVPSPHVLAPMPLSWGDIAVAAGFGLVVWFAYGVDFPSSHKRFAHLA